MMLEQLLKMIRQAELHAVMVEDIHERRDDLRFVGDLAGFFSTAQALDATAVFVSATKMEEEDFIEEMEDEYIYLVELEPSIAAFKKHVGQIASFELAFVAGAERLTLVLDEKWWSEFAEKRRDALQQLIAKAEADRAVESARDAERVKAITKQLDNLVSDKAFAKLPTQRAMLQYAYDRIDGLQEFDPTDVKRRIQELCAKLQARGAR